MLGTSIRKDGIGCAVLCISGTFGFALGSISRSAVVIGPVQIILAQADRDQAVDDLLKKLEEVYGFMTQDKTLDQIESMHNIVAQITQQTLECARFIRDYSEMKNFCESSTS